MTATVLATSALALFIWKWAGDERAFRRRFRELEQQLSDYRALTRPMLDVKGDLIPCVSTVFSH
jgi:hypothetical protein